MTDKEIKALISLLDDTDTEVVNMVSENLLQKGVSVIPELEKAWETTLNEVLQGRLENVIQNIQFNRTKANLGQWVQSGHDYILEGAFYLAQFQFPEIEFNRIDEEIENIRKDVWLEINNNLTALEKVKILNYVIFDLHKYSRNTSNFYSPQNSYINQVIETKKGNPISLAIIYLSIAHKLDLPIYGVNLPKNFILAYKDEFRQYDSKDETEDILFYINPYNKGVVLGKREIDYFLTQQNMEHDQSYYVPCSNAEILIRLINNLILAYEKVGFQDKIQRLNDLIKVVQKIII
ncbi:MAG: transglutaminase family protein [Bacteroidales bacterium]|nr:transglutaminase family protein [Bacteroidales bacterium]